MTSKARGHSVIRRSSPVFVESLSTPATHFIDCERPAPDVQIGHEEGDLLRRAHPGEEPELIVVALCLTPIPVDCGDERFHFLDLKGVDPGAVLLLNACAP
jgi:hypothetical protein